MELLDIQSGRTRRIVAFLIDHFVLCFIAASLVILIMGPEFIDNQDFGEMKTIMISVLIPFSFIYFSKDILNGISLGRWVMGIMVRDENDSRNVPSKARLIIRNLFLVIWPVEFLILAFSKNKQRLGDKVARTIVLRNPERAKKSSRLMVLFAVGIFLFGLTTVYTGITLKSSKAYQAAIQIIEGDEDIIKETGGITGYGYFPKGNINITESNGRAQFEIDVHGNSNDIEIKVFLEKEPGGNWVVTDIRK